MLSHDAPYSSNREPSALRYLETAVRTASPAKLRLMLIERAVGLCHVISQRWREKMPDLGYDEQTLHLRDILTELLSGIGKSDLPVALQVADLYVFLSKHLTSAEMMRDVTMIDEIRIVLETEAETWRIVCETATQHNHRRDPGTPHATSLNLQG
jgi:flagellar secretion chaperone FliS